MNQLQTRLANLRRRLFLVTLVRGLSLLCIIVLGSLFLSGLVDWTVHLPALIRAVLLIGLLGAVVTVAYRFLFVPLSAKADDLALALQVEEQFPVLNDSLASTVQFMNQSGDGPSIGSESLRKEAIGRALRLAQSCDFNKVVDMRGVRLTGALAFVVIALALGLSLWTPTVVHSAFLRLAHPFGDHEWATDTVLKLEFPRRIATGQPFILKGKVTGVIPTGVKMEFSGLARTEVPREYTIKKNDKETEGEFLARLDMSGQLRNFKFRVTANDARSPRRKGRWHTVKVAQPPNLIAVNGQPPPYTTLHLPKYTDLPSPHKLAPGAWQVETIEGTVFHLEAATDRPIVKAWIQYQPGDAIESTIAQMRLLGIHDPLAALALNVGTKQAFARTPAHIDADGKHFSIVFRPWISGNYVLHIEDDEKLPNDYTLPLQIFPDPEPTVQLMQPATNLSLLPNAAITLRVSAEDEQFALRSMYLEYWRKDAKGNRLDAKPRKISLYHHQETAERLAQVADLLPLHVPLHNLRMRPKFLEIERDWQLKGLVKEGEILVIQACADDFNDVVAFNIPGRSRLLELRIVGPTELEAQLDKEQEKIHQNLLRLLEWEEQALKKVIQAEQQLKNAGKLRDDDIRKLMEAEQLQKQIHARIGETKDEGLRKELGRLKQMLKDNKIKSSGAKDRIDIIKKELDRLASENLPQIEPRLSNARQKLDPAVNKKDAGKKDPDKQSPADKANNDISKARANQEEVQQSLANLLKHLERWASFQDIKSEAQALLKEQEELKGDTEKIAQKDPKEPQTKATTQRIAELHRRLGERAQRLLDKMDRVAKEKQESDPKMADLMNRSAKIGKDWLLPKQIQDTDKQLQNDQINRAIKNQDESIDIIKKMIKALYEDRQDQLERLVKKQKDAKKDLDNLVEKLEKLQKKVKDAQKIADPEERKKELQKLADEQRQLQQQAEQKARDMPGMRADGAAREMRKAAEEMKKALQRLEDGENPEEEQKEALDRLEKAQEELEDAQQQARDELEREQLVKIADELRGLKDRQQAAITESERVHRKIQRAGWGQDGLLRTVSAQQTAQIQLAGETGTLGDKLKGAKVFEFVLRKAGEDMNRAAESIKDRLFKSADRLDFPFEEEILKDEHKAHKRIVKFQTRALDRLTRLVDAVNEEIKKLDQKAEKKKDENGEGGKKQDGGDKKGGIRAQDGIPGLAQLKVLRAEQKDINDRTNEFADAHPDNQNLTPENQQELDSIRADQEAVFRLFRELLTKQNENQKGNKGEKK